MKRVILESPYAGDIDGNMEYLGKCVLDCLKRGESPYASHGFFTQFLDDTNPEERKLGIEAGFAWWKGVETVVFYTDRGFSKGMKVAFDQAKQFLLDIEFRSLFDDTERKSN